MNTLKNFPEAATVCASSLSTQCGLIICKPDLNKRIIPEKIVCHYHHYIGFSQTDLFKSTLV